MLIPHPAEDENNNETKLLNSIAILPYSLLIRSISVITCLGPIALGGWVVYRKLPKQMFQHILAKMINFIQKTLPPNFQFS